MANEEDISWVSSDEKELVNFEHGKRSEKVTMQAKMEISVVATNDKVRNYINDDVAFSILSKLPFKSLKRFGCVRKSWSLLFDNADFMSMYRINFLSKCPYDNDTSLILNICNHEQLYSLSGEKFENMVKLDRPSTVPGQRTHLEFFGFSSINGILCFEDDSINKVVLWNPAINEYKVIPPSPFESFSPPATLNFEARVIFDAKPILHGFGYDCVRDDYKLIRHTYIFPFFPDYPDLFTDVPSDRDLSLIRDKALDPFWEIYSLRSNSWRKLDVDMPCYEMRSSSFGTLRVYMDGVCHWLHLDGENNYVGACLISFDLSNEVFINTPIPSFIRVNLSELVVLNGSIACISYDNNMNSFHISVLGELGVMESWIKLFTTGPLLCVEKPIGVGKNGEIFFKQKDYELAWFDLNAKRIEVLGFKGNKFHMRGQIVVYSKSLLPIGAIRK